MNLELCSLSFEVVVIVHSLYCYNTNCMLIYCIAHKLNIFLQYLLMMYCDIHYFTQQVCNV